MIELLCYPKKLYPDLENVKWPTKHIRDNIYSIGMVASDEKWVDKHFTSGDGKTNKVKKHNEVEIVDSTGNPIGEFDAIDIDLKTFVEDKSAKGLNTINPRTGKPYTTPIKWAEKQLYEKTVVRIKNLKEASRTRATKGNSAPSLDEIKNFKKLIFKIEESGNEALEQAVKTQLNKLRVEFPNWEFDVKFGN